MTLKMTLIASLLFHTGVFCAVMTLSPGSMKDTGNMYDEKVLFVKLEEQAPDAGPLKTDLAARVHKSYFQEQAAEKQVQKVFEKKPLPVKESMKDVKAEEDVSVVPDETAIKNIDKSSASDTDESTEMTSLEHGAPANTGVSASNLSEHKESGAVLNSAYRSLSGATDASAGSKRADEIISLISRAIDREKAYPLLARRRGVEGTVQISFSIDQLGHPREIKIERSSGYRILDSATIDVVMKAAPLPYIDKRIEVPVVYQLN